MFIQQNHDRTQITSLEAVKVGLAATQITTKVCSQFFDSCQNFKYPFRGPEWTNSHWTSHLLWVIKWDHVALVTAIMFVAVGGRSGGNKSAKFFCLGPLPTNLKLFST